VVALEQELVLAALVVRVVVALGYVTPVLLVDLVPVVPVVPQEVAKAEAELMILAQEPLKGLLAFRLPSLEQVAVVVARVPIALVVVAVLGEVVDLGLGILGVLGILGLLERLLHIIA
jgi:hypothetical protein